jgi:hypothetical protein
MAEVLLVEHRERLLLRRDILRVDVGREVAVREVNLRIRRRAGAMDIEHCVGKSFGDLTAREQKHLGVENDAQLELEKDSALGLAARNVGSRFQPYGAACVAQTCEHVESEQHKLRPESWKRE